MAKATKIEKKRKDGSINYIWRIRVTKDYKSKDIYASTRKEAEEKARKYMNEIEEYGGELDKTPITLQDLMHKHLFLNIHKSVQKSTFDRYMNMYSKHLKDSKLGLMKIADIKPSNIQIFFNDKIRTSEHNGDLTKLLPRALQNLKFLLNQCFDFAIDENLIRHNPMKNLKMPISDIKRKEIDILTIEEQEKYIKALTFTSHKMFFITALFTGMRRGELIALKWENVDLKNRIITVKESYKRVKVHNSDGTNYNIIDKKEPKTEKGIRQIPIDPFLCAKLAELRKDNPLSIQRHVFINAHGGHLLEDNIRRIQIVACKKAEIPYKNFHALRHTYATRLIENGTDIKTVSTILGHADIQTTLNIYVHSTLDSKHDAANALGEQFKHLML